MKNRLKITGVPCAVAVGLFSARNQPITIWAELASFKAHITGKHHNRKHGGYRHKVGVSVGTRSSISNNCSSSISLPVFQLRDAPGL